MNKAVLVLLCGLEMKQNCSSEQTSEFLKVLHFRRIITIEKYLFSYLPCDSDSLSTCSDRKSYHLQLMPPFIFIWLISSAAEVTTRISRTKRRPVDSRI
jgi:hypothetical protein